MAEPEDPSVERGPAEPGEELSEDIARKYDPSRLLGMVSKRAGRGAPLEHDIRAKFERRWKMDLGHVRVYTGEFADEFNRKRDANAVTVGATGMILMRSGADRNTSSQQGKALLAHEVTHVAQQRRGLFNRELARDITSEDEAQAHAEEDRVAGGGDLGGDNASASNEAAAAKGAAKDIEEAREKVRDRVFEMAADAARLDFMRNSLARRP